MTEAFIGSKVLEQGGVLGKKHVKETKKANMLAEILPTLAPSILVLAGALERP